jgi:hypothetical protein
LSVFVVDDQDQVRQDQGDEQPRDQQYMHDVEPRGDRVAGKLTPEQEERQVGTHDGGGPDDAVGGPEPGAGQKVVR